MIPHDVIKNIVESTFGKPLEIGMVTNHPDGRTVKIRSGTFWSNGRVSNWWTWQEIFANGELGKDESGYGWTPTR